MFKQDMPGDPERAMRGKRRYIALLFPVLLIAAVVGSITLIPGFISYPIASALIKEGASYAVVATFMTTLMMVGVVTLPLEIRYFGGKVAILRNALNFIAAIAIGTFVGFVL